MGWSMRRADAAGGTSRRRAFRPGTESLEGRALLAAIDLINVAGSTAGQPGPYGILELGITGNGGAGYSSAAVGDVNGDGFDDFLVGAPTIVSNSNGPLLDGGDGTVYLVFGSNQVNNQTVNWLTLTAQERIGDLGQLGNNVQTNPINGQSGFAYNGLAFAANSNPNDLLGASVAGVGDVNADGFDDFMIGAPQALDVTGVIPGTGRAYLVYGGQALATRGFKQVDLDNPSGSSDLNILTFVNSQAGALTGFSVGAVGDVLTDGIGDIAIGAPNASYNGLSGNGAAFVISGAFLRPARTQTVLLANVGQAGANNVPGLIFAGALSGDQAGTSVAAAGNFNGDSASALPLPDMLIGSSQTNTGVGAATLVYGSIDLINQGIVTQGVNNASLARIGSTGSNPIPGAVFTGAASGDLTGFALSSAGDFNADGLSDILIGSPQFDGPAGADSGRVTMIFGASGASAPVGTFSLSNLSAAGLGFVEFDGAGGGSLAGFSVAPVGLINNDQINEILIGSPGFNNTQGAVYLVPGNPDLAGIYNLAGAASAPLQATVMTLSQPQSQNFLGSSVSGTFGLNLSNQTIDADGVADMIIGAAGFNPTGGRAYAGGAFALEGALVPLDNIVSSAITSPIGVGRPNAPFTINPTTPADLTLYILSAGSNTAGFTPPVDIDPTTISVNGIALPDPTTFVNAGDLDGDGIDDASFVFSPRSLLGLQVGSRTVTITARTLSTSQFPNQRYSGSARVTVSQGPAPDPVGPALDLSFGPQFANRNLAVPPNGERFLPAFQTMARARWKPIPARLAYQQFLPAGANARRMKQFFHPQKQNTRRTVTLDKNVFNRGRFPNGVKFGRPQHKGLVIGTGGTAAWPNWNART